MDGRGDGGAPVIERRRSRDEHRPDGWGGTTSEQGFDGFYRESYARIAGALTYTLGDEDLAVEAVDEAMARAFARWSSVSAMDNPAGWVYRVALNWARSALRRLRRRPAPPAVRDAPGEVADVDLRRALLHLDVDLRSVVVCRHLCDWSVAQTAQALGLRPGTVKSRLHRALGLLAEQLGTVDGKGEAR